ncbi:primase-associated protein [Haladaptatus cibarius]|uniref:primase-associated protein n=1 Tax=Haladaptatus cibarius TaxID=453847 RepID=UPI000679535A|nr:primase-associated protein [Haladaptatus cibarius]
MIQSRFHDYSHRNTLVAASRKFLARADGYGKQQGEIQAHIADNHLCVPASDFMAKYHEYAEDAFGRLLAVQEETLTVEQRSWLTANGTAITDRIDRFFQAGQTHRVWENYCLSRSGLALILYPFDP